jgi:type VII secretion-associated serine protease mycosin
LRGLRTVAAGLAVAIGLGLPASAAQAATHGYTPSPNEWWLSSWDVPQDVWPLTEGAGVTVGVVDSGVQASVPDLRGVVLPGGDMLGDRGNGEIDHATYEDGHGTGVAVLIAGQGYGADHAVGIAPKAKILPVYIGGTTLPSAKAIKYAVDHGASVINVSVDIADSPTPTSCDPTVQDAVAYALARNVVVVAGSGNTNLTGTGPIEPASCPGVLAVGGIEPSGALWPESTRQPYVSVVAPGDHILAVGLDGRYSTTGNGTSFASPLVAGAAALIRSRYPSMPWYQVDQRLIDTAIHVNGLKIPNNGYGYGIVNVGSAVDAAKYPVAASAPNPVYTRYLAWLKSSDGQAWAKANGVTVPRSPAPSATAKPASSSSSTIVIIAVVIVVVIVAVVVALVLRARKRSRAGSYPSSGWPQR